MSFVAISVRAPKNSVRAPKNVKHINDGGKTLSRDGSHVVEFLLCSEDIQPTMKITKTNGYVIGLCLPNVI